MNVIVAMQEFISSYINKQITLSPSLEMKQNKSQRGNSFEKHIIFCSLVCGQWYTQRKIQNTIVFYNSVIKQMGNYS